MSAARAGAELRLALPTRPENLALVRQALAGLADAHGIEEGPLGDLKQIATEGCMNAIVHAYPPDVEGPMEVRAVVGDGSVELCIRDWGAGFQPRPADSEETSLRLGLPLIATLADSFGISSPADGGTVLTASVRVSPNGQGHASTPPAAPHEAEIRVTAGAAAKSVIARVIAVAATRAGFSIDRMSDGVLLGDAISSHQADDFAEERVGIDFTECGPNLCVRVGPFVDGGAQRMMERMELPDLGVSMGKLASRIEIEHDDSGEFLVVEIQP
jgi:serine/threonine-protein kinase RsbW